MAIAGVGMLDGTIGAGIGVIKTMDYGIPIFIVLGNLRMDMLEASIIILMEDVMGRIPTATEILEAETQAIDLEVYPVVVRLEQSLEHVQLRHEVQILQEIHTTQHEVQQHVLLEIIMVQELQHVQPGRPHNLQGQCDQTQEQQQEQQNQQQEQQDQAQELLDLRILDQHQGQVVL